MKLHEENLYIEYSDFIAAGFPKNTVTNANYRNGGNWQMVKNPADKRMPMVRFDSLTPANKSKLEKFYGDVYDHFAKTPILQLISNDIKAETFFVTYRTPGTNEALPPETIAKYTKAANWLNMLVHVQSQKMDFIRKTLGITTQLFFRHVSDLIRTKNVMLPKAYPKLLKRIHQYKTEGYSCLIHSAYGVSSNAAKINDEQSQDALKKLIEHPNQYDDVMVCVLYNTWAADNGYKTIEPGSVGVWRRKIEPEITPGRYGWDKFNEKYVRQVKGLKVTKVGYLWESDDYNINLYFQDDKNQFSRYVSYIVADSKTGLVLGKSYRPAASPVVEMVKLAYIDAMYYIRQHTGGWYLPFEIKTDRWQQKNLFPWFEQIANFTPPAKGNKHRGYIEQLFGQPHTKRAEKLAAHNTINYNGNNMTAVHRGVNLEALKANEANRPLLGNESDSQIEKFFYLMRHMPAFSRNDMKAPSKHDQFFADWETLTDEQKRPITDEQFLMLFGIKHEPQGRPITITNAGIEPQINGTKYSYDLPDHNNMVHHIGKKVHCIYDPYDMSRILVTDGEGLRFIATTAQLQPRALQDATPGSRTTLNALLAEKKELVNAMGGKAIARQNNQLTFIDSEAIMLAGYMPKEQKNAIEWQAQSLSYEDVDDYDPLQDM